MLTELQIKELKEAIEHQANIETLWSPNTLTENIVCAALRYLHAIIEGDAITAKMAKREYWNLESEM